MLGTANLHSIPKPQISKFAVILRYLFTLPQPQMTFYFRKLEPQSLLLFSPALINKRLLAITALHVSNAINTSQLSSISVKGYSCRKFFCAICYQNNLTDLKINFTKFELSTTFRSYDTTDYIFPYNGCSPLKILPGLPIRNKILKSYRRFLILNNCFAAELL